MLFPQPKIDRAGFASFGAHVAIGAEAATEAAARFRHRLLLGVADLNLVKGLSPPGGLARRHGNLPLRLPTGRIDQ